MGFIAGCLTRGQPAGPGLAAASSEVCRRLLHRAEAASPARLQDPHGEGIVMAGDPGLLRATHNGARLTLVLDSRLTNVVPLMAQLRAAGFPPGGFTDAAVVLAAWCAYGSAMVPYLRGTFAFALHDASTGELTCARDRFGQRPFCYSAQSGKFVFASEVQGLLAWPDCARTPNLDVLAHILTFGHAPLEETAFHEVQRLPPGCLLVRQPGGQVVSRPWYEGPAAGGSPEEPGRDAAAELCGRLDQSVRRTLLESLSATTLGDGPAAAALDASLDRLGMCRPPRPDEPHGDGSHDPMRAVTRLLWHHGEPAVPMSGVALQAAMQPGYSPVLSTAGAAELLLGHGHYQVFAQRLPQLHAEGRQPAWWSGGFRATPPFARDLYHAITGCMTEAERMDLCGPALMHTLLFSQPDALGPSLEWATPADAVSHAARLDLRFRLPGQELPLLDAAAAAAGAEVACPMLDEEFANWCLSLPQAVRLGATGGRRGAYGLLHAAMGPGAHRPAPASAPWPASGSPGAARMAATLANILLDRRCAERGMFARNPLERMLRRYPVDGRGGQVLWAMLCIELWFHDFVDELPRPPVKCSATPPGWASVALFGDMQ